MCEVCIDYIQNLDDSSGWIGGLIYDAFRNIENVFHECKNETLENLIFEWLSKQMKNPGYSDYGCDEGLESIYFELGSNSPYTESTSRLSMNSYRNMKREPTGVLNTGITSF